MIRVQGRGELVGNILQIPVGFRDRTDRLHLVTTDDAVEPDRPGAVATLDFKPGGLGKSGELALRPIVLATGKDLWQLQWLAR